MEKNIILSISLLISDRLETISKCLDSLRPILDAVPSELILVDTSKNPKVRKLLQTYTDHIIPFDWCNDFAKARNAGLKEACGEWFLYLDDDEWFTDCKEIIDFFSTGEYRKFGEACYIQRNYMDMEGLQYSDSWVSRMFRLTPETHFVSKIHEYAVPSVGDRIALESVVDHYGYVFEDEEKARAHYERNSSLLLEEIEQDPGNLRWRMELAQEYLLAAEYVKLYDLGEESLAIAHKVDGINEDVAIQTFYAGMILSLEQRGEFEQMQKVCRLAEEDTRSMGMIRAFVALHLSDLYVQMGRFPEAQSKILEYFTWQDYFTEHPAEYMIQKAAPLAGSCFDGLKLLKAYSIRICAGLGMESTKALEENWERLEWDKDTVYLYDGIFDLLVQNMDRRPENKIWKNVLPVVYRNGLLWNCICEACKEYVNQHGLADGLDQLLDASGLTEEVSAYGQSKGALEELRHGISDKADYESERALLCDYAENTVRFYELHAQGVCTKEQPQVYQAAKYLEQALQIEKVDSAKFFSLLRKCVNVDPFLAEPIKNYSFLYRNHLNELEAARKKELEQLAIQIRSEAKRLMDIGDVENANAILAQLQAMMPEKEKLKKRTMVFLPYKASMWDALESVWKEAREDAECEAYVIPIPYYDKNPDGSIGLMHYEGNLYPEEVPITRYDEFDFAGVHPDAIFIHNPYDASNAATTVHPFFYSDRLKIYTDCLVYIPYYATSGGMAQGQASCPVYANADYIVIQAESYRELFDASIPDEKFLAFGSPKFDRMIQLCKNEPAIPTEWNSAMKGKKVYFYNTSIGGMLENTESFLDKMEYVFSCFEGREDACLLWRPHPLLESTMDSLRKKSRERYYELKQYFMEHHIGIYDDTPDMERSIALSDVYIGDDGTSVTSLFGVAGKPMFILNNAIHEPPKADDWRGSVYYMPQADGNDPYIVAYGNQLYYSPMNDGKYRFYCNLSEYASGGYYLRAFARNGKIYVFPGNAEHILVVHADRSLRKIELPHKVERSGAFNSVLISDHYVFLLPAKYPSLIRFDLRTEEVVMMQDIGAFRTGFCNGNWLVTGACLNLGELHFISFDGGVMLHIDVETMEIRREETRLEQTYCALLPESNEKSVYWLLPYEGTEVIRFDCETGEKRNYNLHVEGLQAFQPNTRREGEEYYFTTLAKYDGWIYFAPAYGNKFVKLNPITGEVREWKSPFSAVQLSSNGYCPVWGHGCFIADNKDSDHWRYFNAHERKTYEVDFASDSVEECEISFDEMNVRAHVRGFGADSQWMRYCCREDAFHSLQDLLDQTLCGAPFDKVQQVKAFAKINASVDGDCGKKVYQFVTQQTEG
mgnify:CR=1 FL=1